MVRPYPCRSWQTGRLMVLTPVPFGSSRLLRWRPEGRRRRRGGCGRSRRAVPPEPRTPQQIKRITDILLHRGAKRKRRKRRTPRTSSRSLRGRARRRQRQWHSMAGCAGYDFHAVFRRAGQRCKASWSVWIRMTVFCVRRRLQQWQTLGWFCCFSSRCVHCRRFHSRGARHHGRCGLGGQYCAYFRQWPVQGWFYW